MLSKFRARLTYANVMSSIAVFLALTGGTAVALSGTDTVFSDDIVNRNVGSADIGIEVVSGGHVKRDSLSGARIAEGAIGRSELLPNIEERSDGFGVPIPPNGGVGEAVATCPEGSEVIGGGGWFDFNSGDLTGSFKNTTRTWVVRGQNNGNLEQDLNAHAFCLTD